jgi:hypothetical protein
MATGNISLLLGSGFSIPEGLPSVSMINNKLSKLKETDFYLSSDQTAGFYHSDWKDPNGWIPESYLDRLFVEEFTSFYCTEYLNSKIEMYDYEKFYDFISDFLRYRIEESKINSFCNTFNNKITTNIYQNDSYNWVSRLKRNFKPTNCRLIVFP